MLSASSRRSWKSCRRIGCDPRRHAPLLHHMAKRGIDLTLATLGLLALAPLFAAVAVAIKCSSPGPVFFRQRRIGRGAVPFELYKFRTMRPDRAGPYVTAASDARITPIGRWLRDWKVDELPQLL